MFCVAVTVVLHAVVGWRTHARCDVTSDLFGAVGDGVVKDTESIRSALAACDEVLLPSGKTFLSGPLNLTSNQVLAVDGTLLASTDKHDYNLIAPLIGYGWGDDMNCFAPGASPHKVSYGMDGLQREMYVVCASLTVVFNKMPRRWGHPEQAAN